MISRIETGRRTLGLDVLVALAGALGVVFDREGERSHRVPAVTDRS